MRLHSVKIKRLRSIEEVELKDCGDFNVFIGKNNSGKSSILLAIDTFFVEINTLLKNLKDAKDGKIITLDYTLKKEIDFFNKETDSPIEIVVIFGLESSDKKDLMKVINEAPQMKNAVGNIEYIQQLLVTLKIFPPPESFSLVTQIKLSGNCVDDIDYRDETVILNIDDGAATEVYQQLVENNKQLSGVNQINKIITRASKTWSENCKYKDITDDSFDEFSKGFFQDYISKSNIIISKIENFYQESQSYEQFIESTIKYLNELKEEAPKNIRKLLMEEESLVINLVSKLKVIHLKEQRRPINQHDAQSFLKLKNTRGFTEKFTNIQDVFSSLLGIEIDAFQGEHGPELDVDNFLVEVNGSGIREALRLVFDFESKQPNILLIEEPEVHLHPALEISMMRYLKGISSRCQILLTTHSTNFLDTGEMQNVYLVSKPDSTQIQKLDIQEAETKIPQELGIRLSSLFMFDRLVFVEGKSDEDVIREWASKLGVNFSQANVGFVIMSGVRNFAHFATETTLSFLTKRQVKMWFLLDRDEKEDSEVSKLQSLLGNNAKLKVLSKREIENYLICPSTIRKFIQSKKELEGKTKDDLPEIPEIDEISNKIEECAEKLKQLSIDKRIIKKLPKLIYLSEQSLLKYSDTNTIVERINLEINSNLKKLEESKKDTENIYNKILSKVEKNWNYKKLDIVPGDLLLDQVCQIYNVRFNKKKDASRMAALMDKDKIDSEICEIIKEIGSSN
ncbi:MAG: AAA family ATPase [Okeania sp. SIO2C9]|uniref:AAA family ATPase n=1 Tax=Okeania sp. SIO2C9 TaxID=2607791 RepID=UPI0013C0EBF4|nr:AAA family ATPase [Okeania sp. SIO2C9]NEQ75023.1 AAA family ATPase [Okeania sp. SIO2C9]